MSKARQQPLSITGFDTFARSYYERLIGGLVVKDEPFPEEQLRGWSVYFQQAYDCYMIDLEEIIPGELDQDEISALYTKSAQSAAQSFKNQRNVNDHLNELLRSVIVSENDDEGSDEETFKAPAVAPALPAIAALDYEQGKSSRKWLDDWIAYAGSVLDGAPKIHLEGAGLFAISALIARRASISGIMNRRYYTNLYIALASKSSTGKSSIAELAVKAMEDMDLDKELIMTGNWTPQLLTQRASGKLDASAFTQMDDNEKANEEKRMVWAGFQSWFYDEFGKFLLRLNSQGNNQQTTRLAELLLDWYYGKGQSQGSLTNGTDRVSEVYLSIIGCMTVSNVKQMQKMGNTFWEDGMFSRIGVLCPPLKEWKDVKLSSGNETTPEEILEPLRAMHQWLGLPLGKIVEKEVGKGSTAYRLQREYWPERNIRAGDEVRQLMENYFNAIGRLTSKPNLVPTALESSYRRLAEYALKISGMLACVNGRSEITQADWIASQGITEEWRLSIHEFYEQVFEPQVSKERELEDRVYEAIKTKAREGKWMTPNDLRRVTNLSIAEISRYINTLADRKLIVACQVPHPKRPKSPTSKYSLPMTALPMNGFFPEKQEEE